MPDPDLRAGYAEADITPPLGGSMAGYFKDRKATGVLDPLKVKALAVAGGGESVAVVACDLVNVPAAIVRRIRERVAKLTTTPPRYVWVHATHTHTGSLLPRADTLTSDAESIFPGFYPGDVDEQWVGQMID